MDQFIDALRQFLTEPFSGFPSWAELAQSMDAVAWTLVALLIVAVLVAVFFSLNTRRVYLQPDEVETTAEMLLARLKQDPTRLPPNTIVARLGSDATLELLEYGDQIRANEWRFRWSSVREALLDLLSSQNAFGPTYALARYYQSADAQEPDTLRIRRTALDPQAGPAALPGAGRGGHARRAAHPLAPGGGAGLARL